ncbi:MAG: HAMP domain-containing histidine kinase [Deltaproteobacteria bacterium]|nr:HAMP domain-containing histidine kinase [Deltaproteobacteria bacterium]
MAGEIYESLHIITLVINRRQDIPLVRSKTKLLAGAAGCPRLAVTQLATAASEMSRLLWQRYGGGKAHFSVIHMLDRGEQTGMELHFEGRKPYINLGDGSRADTVSNLRIREDFDSLEQVRGARCVLDKVVLAQGLVWGMPLRIKCLKWGLGLGWDELQHVAGRIRRDLFTDTEESYVENLKIKHDEVRKLLKEKSARTRELDRVNGELLLLGKNLEELAGERTMVEMSLRIADRIRNPAAIIGGIANLLQARNLGDEKEKNRLRALRKQAEKLEEAVRDFDGLARRNRSLFDDEDLVDAVREALTLCVTLNRKKIRVQVVTPDKRVRVKANRRTLTIALLDVFRYAALASAAGGEVAIQLATCADGHCVTVNYARTHLADAGEKGEYNFTHDLVSQIMAEHQGAVRFRDTGRGGPQSIEIRLPLFWKEPCCRPETIPAG